MPSLIKTRVTKDGKTKTYIVTLPVENPAEGNPKTKSKTFKKLKDARAHVAKWRGDDLDSLTGENPTLEAYLKQWLVWRAIDLRANTRQTYGHKIDWYIAPDLGDVLLRDLTHAHIKNLYLDLNVTRGLSSSTVRGVHAVLHPALDRAVEQGIIRVNPSQGAGLPTRKKVRKSHAMELSEIQAFLSAARATRYTLAFELLAGTGLRPSEACGLEWQDIDLDAAELHVRQSLTVANGGWQVNEPKTPAGRRPVPLTLGVVESLRAWRIKQRHLRSVSLDPWNGTCVLTQPGGGPWVPAKLLYGFKKLRDKLGMSAKYSLYSLRHSYATHLLDQGVGIKTVSKLMGHESVEITLQVYSHSLKSNFGQAREVLDSLFSS